jgi:hypothetical protein
LGAISALILIAEWRRGDLFVVLAARAVERDHGARAGRAIGLIAIGARLADASAALVLILGALHTAQLLAGVIPAECTGDVH